ncbi:MAG: ABC transporter permease [Thermoanaerobaculales bacterium]|nr:ABC transporter permease [Thermoanaerobaculales bacterium]
MMRSVFIIALHDLRVTLRDRSAVMWMFLLPLVFATFFGLVMGGSAGAPTDATAHLTVVDLDGGPMSRALLAELQDERLEVVELDPDEAAASKEKIRTLIIPEAFGHAVLSGTQSILRLEKEPNTSAEAALVVQARIVRAATRLIGRMISAESNGIDLQISGLPERSEAPSMVTVETSFAGRRNTAPSGFSQSVPGHATMFVLLIALTYGASGLASERRAGILRRLVTSPVSREQIIAGKILGRLVVAGLQVTVLMGVAAVAQKFTNLDFGTGVFQMWVVLMVYAASIAPLGVALGGWFNEPERAANVGLLITMAMAAFGGCWWPLEFVSRPLQILALALPTGWTMRSLHGLTSFGHTLGEITPSLGILVLFGFLFTVLAIRSLRVE